MNELTEYFVKLAIEKLAEQNALLAEIRDELRKNNRNMLPTIPCAPPADVWPHTDDLFPFTPTSKNYELL